MKRYFYTIVDDGKLVSVHRSLTRQDRENMVAGNSPFGYPAPANSPLVRSARRQAQTTGWPVEIKK